MHECVKRAAGKRHWPCGGQNFLEISFPHPFRETRPPHQEHLDSLTNRLEAQAESQNASETLDVRYNPYLLCIETDELTATRTTHKHFNFSTAHKMIPPFTMRAPVKGHYIRSPDLALRLKTLPHKKDCT